MTRGALRLQAVLAHPDDESMGAGVSLTGNDDMVERALPVFEEAASES